ncbi:MAG: hypothetical protein RLY14_2852 [Planctomycetota bacterium]|jgi:uncharacterized protein (TIGR03546 family)
MVQDNLMQRAMFTRFSQPWQVGLAIALGLTLGLMPKFNLLMVPLALAILSAPISLGLCLVVAIPTMLISPQLSGVEDSLGSYLLSLPGLRGTWNWMYNQPLLRATRFYNSQELGSLVFATFSFYPVYFATTTFLQRQRKLEEFDSIRSDNSERVPQIERIQQSAASHLPLESRPVAPPRTIPRQTVSRSTATSETLLPKSRSNTTDISMIVADTQPANAAMETSLSAEWISIGKNNIDASTITDLSQMPQNDAGTYEMSNDLIRTTNTESKVQEVDEQQWVLDTLIEIIRIRDEQLPAHVELSPSENIFQDDLKNTLADATPPTAFQKNIDSKDREARTVGDFTNRQQSSSSIAPTDTDTTGATSSGLDTQLNTTKLNMDGITSGNPMEKISRMDKNTAIETEANLFSKDRKDKLMAAASTIANMLPHASRPRPAASRDESLKYLIHHLQSLQRESKE